jgi:hypothetical protein
MDVVKATIRLIAFTLEIDCDQTAMGLPPVTTAELLKKILLNNFGKTWASWWNIEMPLIPLRG